MGDFIRGKSPQGEVFYLPLKTEFEPQEGPYFPIPDEWLYRFPKASLEERVQDQDYLFKRETLSLLPGRNRSNRRNLIAQFERDHPFAELHPVEDDKIPLILGLLDEWESEHPSGDAKNAKEALKYMDPFGIEGIMVEEGNEAVAFALFSPQNNETLLLHFAKSLPRFKGGHAFLLRAVARATSYPWINLEQDLGLSGLRREKEAFVPDLLKKKWWVTSK